MAKIVSKVVKTAKKPVHTDAHCYFEYLEGIGANAEFFDREQIEEYTVDELTLIRKLLEAKGVVQPGEKYLAIRAQGLKRDGDDWTGVITFEYPEGIYEICVEHDLFDS